MKARIPQGAGGPGNLNELMKKAQQMQDEVARLTEELETREYEIKAGGGLVRVLIGGDKQLKELTLSPDIVDPEDVETLQDLILAAVNEAVATVESTSKQELEKVTGAFGMPGM